MNWRRSITVAGLLLGCSAFTARAQSPNEECECDHTKQGAQTTTEQQEESMEHGTAGTGGSGVEVIVPPPAPAPAPATPPPPAEEHLGAYGTGGSGEEAYVAPTYRTEDRGPREERLEKGMGASLNVGGGVEGYTGGLNSRVNPGPSWTATLAAQPLPWMGAEIGYSGATNEVDNRVVGGEGIANGADFVRNGGHIAATVNLPVPILQPYGLVGVGYDHYSMRGGVTGELAGYQSDNAGRVPLGGGLRARVGPLNADARFTYNALFGDDFSSPGGVDTNGGGYDALLQIGGRF